MPLTDTAIKKLQPGDKPVKVTDERGLYRQLDQNAKDDPEGLEHGLAVTSAFLFGPIQPNSIAARPFAPVDHLRVLDRDIHTENPLELYRTLGFVETVLLSRSYQFINLSLGPDLPIEDREVHAWTSVIDDLLSTGDNVSGVIAAVFGTRERHGRFVSQVALARHTTPPVA